MVDENAWQKVTDAIRKAEERYADDEAQKGLKAAGLAEEAAEEEREWQAAIDLTDDLFRAVAGALADRITYKREEGASGPTLELAFNVGKGPHRLRYVFEKRRLPGGRRSATIKEVVFHDRSFSRDVARADFSRSWLRQRVEAWVEGATRV